MTKCVVVSTKLFNKSTGLVFVKVLRNYKKKGIYARITLRFCFWTNLQKKIYWQLNKTSSSSQRPAPSQESPQLFRRVSFWSGGWSFPVWCFPRMTQQGLGHRADTPARALEKDVAWFAANQTLSLNSSASVLYHKKRFDIRLRVPTPFLFFSKFHIPLSVSVFLQLSLTFAYCIFGKLLGGDSRRVYRNREIKCVIIRKVAFFFCKIKSLDDVKSTKSGIISFVRL